MRYFCSASASVTRSSYRRSTQLVMCPSRELRREDIAYYVNRKGAKRAVIFFLILSLAFLLFHLFVSPHIGEDSDLSFASKALARVIGIGGIIVFATLALLFLYRLYSKEPFLVISASGIYDNASGTCSGAGQIEWSEIADVRLAKYHNLPCVEIVLKNRERFLQRFGWVERINRSARLGYPAVAIRGPLLPVEPALLAEQIREYWRRALDT